MPDINLRSYEDKERQLDLHAMVKGIDFGRRVVNSVQSPIGPFIEMNPCPGNVEYDTKDSLLKQTWSRHANRTCDICADDYPWAVLDLRIPVWGTKGMMVMDGSAFSRWPGVFPVLPTSKLSLETADAFFKDCNSW
jgi:choline dehydrogenase